MDEETPALSTPRLWSRKMTFSVVFLVLVVASAGYYAYRSSTSQNSSVAAQEEAEQLVAQVSKLMVLPSDEQPIIATVADPTKLQDQPFFSKAKKGDKVLIYNEAHKAVLYDPVAGRIIDVAPLSIGQSSPTPKPTK